MSQSSPLHSMTGFGRASREQQGLSISVEFRSVNHRYLDTRVKLPLDMNYLEMDIRKCVKATLSRGRVDCTIKLSTSVEGAVLPHLKVEAVEHYRSLFTELGKALGEKNTLPPLHVFLQLPGVLSEEQSNEERELLSETVMEAVQEALGQLTNMRLSEGAQLAEHLEALLVSYEMSLVQIEARASSVPKELFQRLQERLKQFELDVEVDPTRLHQEVAILAERCDVTEELKRIKSHLKQFRGFLSEGKAVGRRMDFLCQELLRETNTIGSKNVDAEIGRCLIAMKSAIEKLREQVQNVE